MRPRERMKIRPQLLPRPGFAVIADRNAAAAGPAARSTGLFTPEGGFQRRQPDLSHPVSLGDGESSGRGEFAQQLG